MSFHLKHHILLLFGILSLTLAQVAAAEPEGKELPTHPIPNIGLAAEFYFAPDSQHIIGNAKRQGDESFHVYTLKIDGTEIKRINDVGDDACSYYFPDGKSLVWTSTRDHLDLPKGNYSDPKNYPQGAELYRSDLDGKQVKRLTWNNQYDAEVSVSPDGKWILFGRQTEGKLDLWKMLADGSQQQQVTHLEGWQPGGAFYLPDGHTIIFRAWRQEVEGKGKGLPMTIFTIHDDGTGLRQITHDSGTNWAPFPAPDGRHFAFVKVLPERNYEIFLGDLESDQQVRLTYNNAFDGFPVISPDGHWLLFASTRDSAPGSRQMTLYLQDISSLNLGPKAASAEGSLAELGSLLEGSFTSADQAKADPDHFSDIRLEVARIWRDRKDGLWFYVEQAEADKLAKPYRQRVYNLVSLPGGGYQSLIYSFKNDPLVHAGAWKAKEPLKGLDPEALETRRGCAVFLKYDPAHAAYTGSTSAQNCESKHRGATYATTDVSLTASELVSWDRGFDATGKQVWGATLGGYRFRKLAGR